MEEDFLVVVSSVLSETLEPRALKKNRGGCLKFEDSGDKESPRYMGK